MTSNLTIFIFIKTRLCRQGSISTTNAIINSVEMLIFQSNASLDRILQKWTFKNWWSRTNDAL